ncbi:hypothetical protein L593_04005 [Salinarchaeum sp. Harcht-Bsk1]|uniref:winged helix-turn-helix domain-containing protein n=1 Tax=Salinarchaeum sp. Harcht-Bsk1 TaxID=1333523 RepID=UPI00034230C4|nr:winged helix-turn-helix domain-containing protein [Salinarchaeum sp. Harcht-Bsk1]AGN00752.1 hypothetical protein L593_04005 [Salinarchaeum sp. Harcht-Bsk1]
MTEEDTDSLSDDSEAVFSVLGDETRLRILLELAERSQPDASAEPYAFSELRRAVSVDDAGRFNYHLDKLQDTFVKKTEDGYRPTFAGLNVASSIHAGRFGSSADVEPTETEYECPVCEDPLYARYEDESVRIECDDEHTWFAYPVPAGAATDRSMDELLDVTVRRTGANVELARNGLCHRCWGTIDARVVDPDGTFEELGTDWPRVDVECERCWLAYTVPLPIFVAQSPPVVAFYHEHGLGPEDAMLSERNALEDATAELEGSSSDLFEVTIELAADHLTIVVDREGQIQAFERTRGDSTT